ncbi:Rv2231c family pyridoxal phosphate-dependent protein CobC [Rhodococcus sp. 27YEA15]|uniref:Rv2231c family pyridoxal phosphate-dependent protein CobC n=1 Tax=Rhodococcus sp. 27YEA15 TaxID=3156259 RepID=UPI003C7EB5F9
MSNGAGDLAGLRHHGDVDAEPGLLDFAVNVQGSGPPDWLRERLATQLPTLGSYPSASAERRARETVARRHGRDPAEVLLLSGGAEGFAMLPRLRPREAALIHPSFTEPELALREAAVPVTQVILRAPYALRDARVPESADMVVLGNPTNPTSVLHPRDDVLALGRPGRLLVVDEAFADALPNETESVADQPDPNILVLRSLTKTWALAGLRCGYALGSPDILAQLAYGRAHWPLGSLQLEAITACCEPYAVEQARIKAVSIGSDRDAMCRELRRIGMEIDDAAAGPFLLIEVPDGEQVRRLLRARSIAVRRCDTFPGLGPNHIRLAVRPAEQVSILTDALKEIL